VLFPNVPEANLAALQAEPFFLKYKINPGNLERGLVSCTGSQFCGFALIETKARAMAVVEKLEASLNIPKTVRVHWTGCPNSCGQAQVGDIGLMGAPAKLDGKAVEGVRIFLGGKVGEGPELARELEAGVPVAEHVLLPKLTELLVEHFGATPKEGAAAAVTA
jgi:ferredoxin-nitrite reductase